MTQSPPYTQPLTKDQVEAAFDYIFAPLIKDMGLCEFRVEPGRASARLPAGDHLKFFAGAICGQAMMAAVDTVTVLAMMTSDRQAKATSYQHTHFLRPAMGEDLVIESHVKRFGGSSAYAECDIKLAGSEKLVAHAVLEFAF